MGSRVGRTPLAVLSAVLLVSALAASPVIAGDWIHWRGPLRNGTSPETELIDSWSVDGENLLWRVDFAGRSTPLVLGNRVCVDGRAGEGIDHQEVAACFDVATGEQLWEQRFNVYHTTVPWTRAGLMSDRPIEEVRHRLDEAIAAARRLGTTLHDPFMAMSFLALEVIPSLKLTDKGLVDVDRFELVSLWVE